MIKYVLNLYTIHFPAFIHSAKHTHTHKELLPVCAVTLFIGVYICLARNKYKKNKFSLRVWLAKIIFKVM